MAALKGSSGVALRNVGSDDARASAMVEQVNKVQDQLQPPTQTIQRGAATDEAREGVPIQHDFKGTGVDTLMAKRAVANNVGGAAQIPITKSDVDAYRQIKANDLMVQFDRWTAEKYPLDVPGGMEHMMRVAPDLVERAEKGIKNKYAVLEKLERAKRLAPKNSDDLFFQFLVEQGQVDPSYLSAFDRMNDIKTESPNLQQRWSRGMSSLVAPVRSFLWGEDRLGNNPSVAAGQFQNQDPLSTNNTVLGGTSKLGAGARI